MVNNILGLTRCLVRSHRVLDKALQFLLFAQSYHIRGRERWEYFFTQPCKPAAISTESSLYHRHSHNKNIQKRRENKYMAEGWIFFQLQLLLVPVCLSSQSIYCYYLPYLLTATALQNVSATSLYHLLGDVAYAS